MINTPANPSSDTPSVPAETAAEGSVTGRSVFLIETVAAGVSVRTVFLAEDQRLLEMPAVFPELGYALAQIEELKRAVMQHFAQAAQVGAQVIAAQAAQAAPAPAAEPVAQAAEEAVAA